MLDIDKVEGAEAKMTPAPWSVYRCNNGCALTGAKGMSVSAWHAEIAGDDFDGIAILRNSAREMTQEIRRLLETVEVLEHELALERGERREKDIAAACDPLHDVIHGLRRKCGEVADLIDGTADKRCVGLDELCDDLRAASKGGDT